MAHLTGRSVKTVINSLEVVSDDSTQVVFFFRNEDGSVSFGIRPAYEDHWNSPRRFSVSKSDAALLGALFSSGDAQYMSDRVKAITPTSFKVENPNPAPDPNAPDCTQLDIERARAENLKEERELLRLSLIRDHSLNKHVGVRIDGCEPCGIPLVDGTIDSLDPNDPNSVAFGSVGSSDAPDEEIPF